MESGRQEVKADPCNSALRALAGPLSYGMSRARFDRRTGKGAGGMHFRRYAVYYTPRAESALARFGASWLGWDMAAGKPLRHPEMPDLPQPVARLTETPRRYGFHATIKPPFRLAPGTTAQGLADALERLCVQMPPVLLDGLEIAALGRFLALVPQGDQTALGGMAALVVDTLDAFRAAPTEEELKKRRKPGLSAQQEALLRRWGYPYVMEAFRFHMTLTGKLPKGDIDPVIAALRPRLSEVLPRPFAVDGLSLVGEAEDGRFHVLHRHTLTV
jgi:putative phosphonate metabolism protein